MVVDLNARGLWFGSRKGYLFKVLLAVLVLPFLCFQTYFESCQDLSLFANLKKLFLFVCLVATAQNLDCD